MKPTKKRKKNKILGKGADRDIHINHEIDILNYVPIDYGYTQKWANFNDTAEDYFEDIIARTSIDELNCNMLDPLIDAETTDMIANAKEQYTHHLRTVYSEAGVLEGQIQKANDKLETLEADEMRFDEEIDALLRIMKENDVI